MHSRNVLAHRPATTSLAATWTWVVGFLRRQAKRLGREHRARRAAEQLSALDDRMLCDIGMDRGSIGFAARHGHLPREHAPLGLRSASYREAGTLGRRPPRSA